MREEIHSPLEGVVEKAPLTRGVGGFGGNHASFALPRLETNPPDPPCQGGRSDVPRRGVFQQPREARICLTRPMRERLHSSPHKQKAAPCSGPPLLFNPDAGLPNAPKPGIAKRWGLLIIPFPHREDSNSVAWVGKFAPDDREQPMSNPQRSYLLLCNPLSLSCQARPRPGAHRQAPRPQAAESLLLDYRYFLSNSPRPRGYTAPRPEASCVLLASTPACARRTRPRSSRSRRRPSRQRPSSYPCRQCG